MRVLVTGWPSFLHGEATAGDVLGMRAVAGRLRAANIEGEAAWSPAFRPGALHLDDAEPGRYTHVVFACGPAHGWQLRELHERYARCRRIAVGVSVIDQTDPAVIGFHRVLARDDGGLADPDLATTPAVGRVPVVGVSLAPEQPEYGPRCRHEFVHSALGAWLATVDCARVSLDTRLGPTDLWHCATPDQFASLVSRMDAVVTTRLHGLVFALRAGVPVLAVDPVAGGGEVSAQARVLHWPALVGARDAVCGGAVGRWWRWCLSPRGHAHAGRCAAMTDSALDHPLLTALLRELCVEHVA